jgi:hypothetical protein
MTAENDAASCSLVETERRFEGAYCVHTDDRISET